MLRLALRRLAWSVPLLFTVSAVTFVLLALTPGDPAIAILGDEAPPEAYARLREELGVNDPIHAQYWNWLTAALQGDLGSSLFSGESVTTTIASRLPVTIWLVLATTCVTTIVGVGLGILAATRTGFTQRAIDVLSLMGMAIPNYWLGLILIAIFAVAWEVFPATGYVSPTDSPAEWARSLVLPVVVMAVGGVTFLAKQTRDAMLDALGRDYIHTLRANGVSERSIVFRHALRNAAIPTITVVGFMFAGMLSGTVIVESLFVLPGLGSLAVESTLRHDVPMVQGVALFFTLLVVVINLVVDLTYGLLNPRARVT